MARISIRKLRTIALTGTIVIFTIIILEYRYDKRIKTISQGLSKIGLSWQILKTDFSNDSLVSKLTSDGNATMLNCSETPETLFGRLKVDFNPISGSLDDLVLNESSTHFGGWWEPNDCLPRVKVAILIPYRNRLDQLKLFLRHIIPVLERQLLSYRIFVIEQVGKTAFNKGAIYNIGFNATLAFDDYDCYIFHDVDLFVENDLNYYGCPTSPRHMSVAIDKFQYKLPYEKIFGGIQAFTKEHYIKANGFSNSYWGWGGEDDDMYNRITKKGFHLTRPSFVIGRYKMNQKHHFNSDPGNPRNRILAARGARNMDKDGLNTISSLKGVVKVQEKRLCTLVSIDLIRT